MYMYVALVKSSRNVLQSTSILVNGEENMILAAMNGLQMALISLFLVRYLPVSGDSSGITHLFRRGCASCEWSRHTSGHRKQHCQRKSKPAAIEAELRRLLGVEKIIWFPGINDLNVTDVHVDAEVNFVRPGVVAPSIPRPWVEVYEEIRDILGQSVDVKGRPFETSRTPKIFGVLSYDDPVSNYVNFYFVNGGLILPQFGDIRRDQESLVLFQKLCPDRVVRHVFMSALPLTEGVIHCATQPVLFRR
ncbi:Peptidyl-arginine deiminase Porphyromonas-type [Penicillium robsamsonii]|uniref:Peptidyl-arginine deiminase Porphyromonas-type n=1 Tax=Penicillium robsamsonii TaxID=1792511 RepID=UPI002547FB15|nr:Peptidyl-arginine deiminase Porphyromonas-type [Penicillium robsamsonii]KAJ5835452.1 Peptidyl-arginine deiminase Porphyromonas-type [Penicillium robsamsonii]